MKEILLTRGYVAFVDDEDYATLAAHKWHVKLNRGRAYAVRNNPRGLTPRVLKMHRVIMGAMPGQLIDHRDGNGLDNQRQNLRHADDSKNQANRRVVNGRYGFKGVSHHPYTQNKGRRWTRNKPWCATVMIDRKAIKLGYFLSADEAAAAYDKGAVKYFGEFAATNAALGLL